MPARATDIVVRLDECAGQNWDFVVDHLEEITELLTSASDEIQRLRTEVAVLERQIDALSAGWSEVRR